MGGMSAQIPIKDDPKANEIAMNKVRADKLREVQAGHDGTWIAHPLINKIAREVFDEHMLGPNQVRSSKFVQLTLNNLRWIVLCSPFRRQGRRQRLTQHQRPRKDHLSRRQG